MIRAWVNPIFTSVPKDVRYSGMFPMSLYAAINPLSWIKSPYFGIITYAILWWWLWNRNMWNIVKYKGETCENDKMYWILRASMWAFFFNPIMLFFVYLTVLTFVKITSLNVDM